MADDRRTPDTIDPCAHPDELVALMRAGNIEALDGLTRCYGQTLAVVGRRYCRTGVDAEDAVQDALVAAGEHLQDYRGEGPPEGWLVRMVIHACRRMQRGRKNAPGLHADIDDAGLATPEDDPEALAGRAQIASALGNALLALDPRDRTLLLLAEAEDWTAPEIAREFGLSPGAVRTRLSRIRARVRPQLAEIAPARQTGEGGAV